MIFISICDDKLKNMERFNEINDRRYDELKDKQFIEKKNAKMKNEVQTHYNLHAPMDKEKINRITFVRLITHSLHNQDKE
jgi:hypothetical protein